MSAFGNCIELLDDINQFEVTVQGLGKAHKKIGINVGHLGVSMPVLLYVGLSLNLLEYKLKRTDLVNLVCSSSSIHDKIKTDNHNYNVIL